MIERWRFDRMSFRSVMILLLLLFVLLSDQNLSFSSPLNSEALALMRIRDGVVRDPFGVLSSWKDHDGQVDPCSWFGIECSDGKVVILNLKDLCLGGTLGTEIGKLTHIQSIILRNNSFSGKIPKEIGQLKELEVLDLGINNFSGSFPSEFSNNFSLTTLLLDNNKFISNISPELYDLRLQSENLMDDKNYIACNIGPSRNSAYQRKLLAAVAEKPPFLKGRNEIDIDLSAPVPSLPSLPLASLSDPPSSSLFPSLTPSPSPVSPSSSALNLPFFPFFNPPILPPSPSPSPSSPTTFLNPPESSPVIAPTQAPASAPPPHHHSPHRFPIPSSPSSSSFPRQEEEAMENTEDHTVKIVAGIVGGSIAALIAAITFVIIRSNKVVTVKPWASGISRQLQRAFVTGVPKLKRSELEAACEDFSNIIGSFSDGTVYKGTLSSGVEIAVSSTSVTSVKDWSKSMETQFVTKIETLSKVNHKNFVNLVGYCEEEQPFTRMMVFEYAPNGTLFEHLHIKEAEHLEWGTRLRIAMGMAYCLEHMHQLNPPIPHRDLQSSSIYLTEDYAAKVSDFSFWTEVIESKIGSAGLELVQIDVADSANNVYGLGVILFEMVTGRIPYSVDNGTIADWALDYLKEKQSLREMVDPALSSYIEDEVEKLFQVIKVCIDPELKQRPTMTEVTSMLKDITRMEPDGASPKLSALWWAELEIMSSETT